MGSRRPDLLVPEALRRPPLLGRGPLVTPPDSHVKSSVR